MASIPNLNTLRRGRGGPRLRGRHNGPHYGGSDSSDSPNTKDKIIQQTDNDASSSRLSAVELGYLQDEYAKALAASDEPPVRRYPLINRGTYVRTTAIDRLFVQFLQTNSQIKKQVISLGAGSDTRFFRLCEGSQVTYHELDFAVNIVAKRTAIERSPFLRGRQKMLQEAGCSYQLHAVDLRDLRPGVVSALDGIDPTQSTLILSECCLCYLSPEDASATIAFFTQQLQSSVAIILYEPVRPNDAFGRTMVINLASRGIHLQTLKRFGSLEAQRQRLKLAGFTTAQGARDVFQIWQSDDWIAAKERERLERLEWLDEVEEWNLLASHYCVAWAARGDDIAQAWSGIEGSATDNELQHE